MASCVPLRRPFRAFQKPLKTHERLIVVRLPRKLEAQKFFRVLEVSGDFRVTVDQTVDQNNHLTVN